MDERPTIRTAFNESLLGGAFAEKFSDVEVHEVGVMENNRLDRALDLVALVTVRGDDVQHFAGNAVLVSERDAGEWVPHLLAKCALNHFARRILIKLERLAHIGQQRAGDENISLNWNIAAERFFKHVRNGDALPSARIE